MECMIRKKQGGRQRRQQWRQGNPQCAVFSVWLTEDVVARRMDHMTDAERMVLSKCALCGEVAKGRGNESLLFECTAESVVKLRKEVEAAVEKKVSRLVKPGPVREAIMVPWRLDGAGRPPTVEVMAEVEAALGTVLGAASPAEGFRRLVTKPGKVLTR